VNLLTQPILLLGLGFIWITGLQMSAQVSWLLCHSHRSNPSSCLVPKWSSNHLGLRQVCFGNLDCLYWSCLTLCAGSWKLTSVVSRSGGRLGTDLPHEEDLISETISRLVDDIRSRENAT
jgi:hypothetical protein